MGVPFRVGSDPISLLYPEPLGGSPEAPPDQSNDEWNIEVLSAGSRVLSVLCAIHTQSLISCSWVNSSKWKRHTFKVSVRNQSKDPFPLYSIKKCCQQHLIKPVTVLAWRSFY